MSISEIKSRLQTEVHSQLIKYYAGIIVVAVTAIIAFFAGGAFSTFRDFSSLNLRVYALEESTNGIPAILDTLKVVDSRLVNVDGRLNSIELAQNTVIQLLQVISSK